MSEKKLRSSFGELFRLRKNPGKKEGDKGKFLLPLSGAVSGFINGFFGGGGGMIVVPMLKKFCLYEEKTAHATAIAIILPITIVSGFLSFHTLDESPLTVVLITVGSAVGGVIGALFLKKARSEIINYIFLSLMMIAGVKLLFF